MVGEYERGVLDGMELAMAAGKNAPELLKALRADRLKRVVRYFGIESKIAPKVPAQAEPITVEEIWELPFATRDSTSPVDARQEAA